MTGYQRVLLLAGIFLCFVANVYAQCTLTANITSTNNGVICSGNSITLTANPQNGTAPYTYVWNTGETTQSITINRGDTYSVSVTDKTDGCQPVTTSTTITEVAGPGTPVAPGQTVCQNTPATLTATAPGGDYRWYDAPAGGNLLATGATFTTQPIQQKTFFYVETTLNGCTSPRTTVQVELTGTPQVNVQGVCAGNSTTIQAFGGTTYTWYDAPGGKVLATGSTFTTPALTATTTYYVVAIINGCASAPTPATVPVTPYPPPPTFTAPTICSGNSANLHADANGVIEWYNVPSGGSPLITSPDYTTPKLTTTTTFYVQNSFNGCVSQRVPIVVTVNPIPDTPTVPAQSVCEGTTATLTASAANAATINWYAADGSTLLFTGNPYQTSAINANTTFYVQTVNGGCASTLMPVQVSIIARPPTPTASVTPVCPNTPSTLRALTPGGTYQWYDAPTGGNLLATGETYTTPPITANTTYYLQTTVDNCVSNRAAIVATLLPPATPPIANSTTICNGDVATLVASGSDNYQWYDAETGGNLVTAGRVFITPALTSTVTYYVQTIINGCNSARTAVTVTVNAKPEAPVVAGQHLCPGSTAVLTATVPAGGAITWYDFFGNVVATGPTYTTGILYENTSYYLENQVGPCTSARVQVTVIIEPILYPQFKYTSGTFCKNGGNVKPEITDPFGGVFSAPSGLKFVSNTTGEIDVANSLPGTYNVRFVGNETCHAITESPISIVIVPNAVFSYQGPYCQYAANNPSPQFPIGATGGNFTATPAGLVFLEGTSGIIDLKKSLPGTYTVTNTIPADGSCPETSASNTVLIGPGVTVDAGPDQRVKTGQPVQLNGVINGVSNGTWSGGNGTFSNAADLKATYTPAAGETSVILTLRSEDPPGNCGAKSDQVRIIFDPKPSAPIVEDASICTGSGANLAATAPGGTYAWFDAATGGTQVGSGPNFTTPPLTANTTYYVQTTIGANTSDRTAVTVTVNNIPDEPTAKVDPTCYNTPATLTAQGSTGVYRWYDAPTGGTLLATGTTFTTPPLQNNVTYYLQAMAGGCPSTRFKIDVIVKRGPAITSEKTGGICTSNPLIYTISSNIDNATYTWERPAVTGISNPAVASHTASTIQETLINTTLSPMNVIYNITATGNGCTTQFQYTVTVNPGANLSSDATRSICNAEPIDYDVQFTAPVSDFTWTRDAVPGVANSPVAGQAATSIRERLTNTTNLPVPVTYRFNYASGNCTSTATFVATINPSVFVTSPVSPTAACNGLPFVYNIESNIAGATFIWSRAAVPGVSNPSVTDQTSATINETLINTTNGPVNVVYFLYARAYNCQSPLAALVVTIYPIPQQPVANSNSPVCLGNTIRLQSPVVPNATYRWTGPNGFTSTERNPAPIINATHANEGTYSLVVIIDGCESPAATTTVQVNDPPTANAGADQTICITQTDVILHGVIGGGTKTGIWTSSGSGSFSATNDVGNAVYHPSAQDKANGSVVVKLTSTSKDDCSPAVDELTITFAPTPAVEAGDNLEVCTQNTAIPLAGRLIKPGAVNWTTSGTGSFSPSATSPTASYIPGPEDIGNGTVTLTLHYTNAGVCDIESDQLTIKFIPPPNVNAGGRRFVLKGNTITLRPTVSDANVTYLWTPNIGLNDNTIKNPVVTGDVDRIYTLTVTDVRGCINTDQAEIKVSPVININNTFTPNNDGVNDLWTITGLVAYVKATVDVYDRYGRPVYHSIGYDQAWDGTYNGQQVPAGVYYYIVRLNVDNKVLSGSVTVIR